MRVVAILLSALALFVCLTLTAPAAVEAVSVIRKIEHRLRSKALHATDRTAIDADADAEVAQSFLDHKLLTFAEGAKADSQGSYHLVALTDGRLNEYGKVYQANNNNPPYAGLKVVSNRNGNWVLYPDPRSTKTEDVDQHLTMNYQKPAKGASWPHITTRNNKKSPFTAAKEVRTLFYYRAATANPVSTCPSCGGDHANDPADVKVAIAVFAPFSSVDKTPLGAAAADVAALKALFQADAGLLKEWEAMCQIMSTAILDQKVPFFL